MQKRDMGKGKARARGSRDRVDTPEMNNPFGFGRVWARMAVLHTEEEGQSGAAGLFKVVVKRLEGTGDLELVAQR
jgi:engulfment/cell motility protein 1